MSIYVVIPAINELSNLKVLVPNMLLNYPEFKLLIIDDSQDTATRDWVKDTFNENQVKALHQTNSTGFANAVTLGFHHAVLNEAKWVFQMDADGTHPISLMKDMLKTIQDNKLDLVIGNRWSGEVKVRNFAFHRKILSYGSKVYCRIHLGRVVTDWTSGFKVMNRETAELFINVQERLRLNSFAFQAITTKVAVQEKKNISECAIDLQPRMNGNSKLQLGTIVEALRVIRKF
jgi:glycosyltransferase involved in cell wall biosynthesis